MVLAIKSLVLYGVGLGAGLKHSGAKRLALAASQVGEFAFVLFAAASQGSVINKPLADLLAVVATLSMIATPILIGLDSLLARKPMPAPRAFDPLPQHEGGHVIIAGFGRFGQIVARVLAARRIPFIALDKNIEQVDFVRGFGSEVYFGDATRVQLLEAARAQEARAFVLAIDDVEESIATAELVRRRFPGLVIYARARNRRHAHRLMDLGVELIRRETFLSALEMTEMLLRGLGLSATEATRTVETFRDHDRRRLYEDWRHYTDVEKLRELAKDYARELKEQFEADASEPKQRPAPAPSPQPVLPIAHEH
jgi:glutathione-regulated potassium-efflux system protein KefB